MRFGMERIAATYWEAQYVDPYAEHDFLYEVDVPEEEGKEMLRLQTELEKYRVLLMDMALRANVCTE